MFRKIRPLIFVAGSLVSFGITETAGATLIGDQVRVTYLQNDAIIFGPLDAVVGDGVEFPGEISVDFGASRIDLSTENGLVFGTFDILFSDLDWIGEAGEIVGVEMTLDPELTGDVSFAPHSVTFSNTGGGPQNGGVFASFDLITRHTAVVPEPASIALFAAGITGLGLTGFGFTGRSYARRWRRT
ncbi:hypothetical protein [Pelagibius sp. Alg239-R121]|uniref:hypothetical protein n=1 Tax=Pelagibius sp. Alg239-R121 TaxID=2993448 RepID=UPI0024A65B97|nr:hypothetical protein [Pelagibius sp. Alg239-R121]